MKSKTTWDDSKPDPIADIKAAKEQIEKQSGYLPKITFSIKERYEMNRDNYLSNIFYNQEINFDTWEGFGKLWKWAQEQSWFFKFCFQLTKKHKSKQRMTGMTGMIHSGWIKPSTFANAIYEYLKEKDNETHS